MKILSQFNHRLWAISCFSGRGVWGVLAIFLLSGCSILTPVMTDEEQEKLAQQDQERIFKDQKALSGPLTLHEAMARAIKYNLDYRLKRMEEALSKSQEDISRLDMLPKMTFAAGYSDRTGNTASVSESVSSGVVSTDPSLSRASAVGTADLSMSWNLLDFGVSYFQARQESNKQLIQGELRRKAAHNLLKDVRFAFWKAASAQWLEREIGAIQQASEEAIDIARKVEKEGLRSPVHALQFQLSLLEVVRQLGKSRADLAIAKEELATLINLEPGVAYELTDDSGGMEAGLELGVPVDGLEQMALSSRPELRIEHYQARIEADETRKAIARLFPGLEFDVSAHFDDNAFLVYQHWAQAGARLSWNLVRTLTGNKQKSLADSRENVIQMRRFVLHMAVVSQTRIAFHEYRAAREALQSTISENQTRHRLQDHTGHRSSMGLDSQLTFVHTVAASALGRIRQYEAYARYQSALGRLYATVGLDPVMDVNLRGEIPQLTRQFRENDMQWQTRLFSPTHAQPYFNAKTTKPIDWSVLRPKSVDLSLQGVDLSPVVMPDGPVQSSVRTAPVGKLKEKSKIKEQTKWVEPPGMPEQPRVQEPLPLPEQPKVQEALALPEQPRVQEPLPLPEQPKVQEPLALPEQPRVQEPLPLPEQSRVQEPLPLPEQPKVQEALALPEQSKMQEALALPEQSRESEISKLPAPSKIVAQQSVKSEPEKSTREVKARFAVQVAATMDAAGVDALLSKLRAKGYHPYVDETPGVDGRMIKRVWIGRFVNNQEAVAARDRYQKKERQSAFIKTIDD